MVQLSILIVTIGRDTLSRTFESIVEQLDECDFLYIAIDGPAFYEKAKLQIDAYRNSFKCKIIVFEHPVNVGFWGNELRTFYQTKLEGDYIMYSDDDDVYTRNALSHIRNAIGNKRGKLFVFKMCLCYDNHRLVPQGNSMEKVFRFTNIGAPCGVVANEPSKLGVWPPTGGGDCEFWTQTAQKFSQENIEYSECVTYCALERSCDKSAQDLQEIHENIKR